ncbi:MAG: ABC transporter ATP-binding protein [Anaerolineae bacterium]|nr:ABC transporter ATP-binding protein [Anaerolineae bacterium]
MKLELDRVSKTFYDTGTTPAIAELSFTAQPGEFITLIGPSGSGKSTIFNLITGLLKPDAGEIRLDGRVINGQTGLVGYMPQRDLLLPWRSVLDNVILGPEIAGKSLDVARTRARQLLPMFGLEAFANAYPAALSGGMRQRAALLRTFLCERDVLLLDEPFGALDALTRRDLQRWLLGVWAEFKPTILFITHDVQEAVMLGDQVLVFSPRPGRIQRELVIDLPRPRIESDDRFIRLQATLLQSLEQGLIAQERT